MKLILCEIAAYAVIPLTIWLFWKFRRQKVWGDMVAGGLIGIFNEFATEPLWNYHFRINIYKDVPAAVILAWGLMFTLVTFLSGRLYCKCLGLPAIRPFDKKIFLFDVAAGLLIGLPFEAVGLYLGIWDYNAGMLQWTWPHLPFLNLPLEAIVGYGLFTLLGPTFVRYWQGSFEGHPGIETDVTTGGPHA